MVLLLIYSIMNLIKIEPTYLCKDQIFKIYISSHFSRSLYSIT